MEKIKYLNPGLSFDIIIDYQNLVHIAHYTQFATKKYKQNSLNSESSSYSNNDEFLSTFLYVLIWKIEGVIKESITQYIKLYKQEYYNETKKKINNKKFLLQEFKDIYSFNKPNLSIYIADEYYPRKNYNKEIIDTRKQIENTYKKSVSREKLKEKYKNIRFEIYNIARKVKYTLPVYYLTPVFNDSSNEIKLEADDIIINKVLDLSNDKNKTIIIISGDKDLQYLNSLHNVFVFSPVKKEFTKPIKLEYTYSELKEYIYKYLFEKLLFGDTSDNIPAIYKRVGAKIRNKKELLNNYISFLQKEGVILDIIEPFSLKNLLNNTKKIANITETFFKNIENIKLPQEEIVKQLTLIFPILDNCYGSFTIEAQKNYKNEDQLKAEYYELLESFSIKRTPDFEFFKLDNILTIL